MGFITGAKLQQGGGSGAPGEVQDIRMGEREGKRESEEEKEGEGKGKGEYMLGPHSSVFFPWPRWTRDPTMQLAHTLLRRRNPSELIMTDGTFQKRARTQDEIWVTPKLHRAAIRANE